MAKFKKRFPRKFPVSQAVRDQIIRDQEQKRVLKHQVRNTQPITELTKEVVLPSLDLVRKELCTRKLSEFIKYFWSVLEPTTTFSSNWHIEAISEHLEAVTSGQIRNLLINIPPRHMKPCYVKCKVLEKRRGRINLGDIVVGDEVLTHMGRFRKVSAVHEQGLLTLYKINTWRGRVAYAAEDHPFLTTRGWVLARDLTDKDFLAEVHPQEDCGTETVCDEEARLIGYLVGDGCVKYKTAAFTNQDSETLEDFLHCAEFLDFAYRKDIDKRSKNKPIVTIYLKPKGDGGFCPNHPDVHTDWKFNYCTECRNKKQIRINNGSKTSKKGFSSKRRENQYDVCECGKPKAKASSRCYACSGRSLDQGQFDDPAIIETNQNPVLSWLETHDLFEKSSYTKTVPSSILAGTNRIVSEFLAAYWSCDGTIAYRTDIRNKDNFTMKVESVTVSEQLAKGVQHLLTRLGISSVVRKQERKLKTKRQGETYVFWRVTMTTQDDISKFMSIIGSKIRNEKKSRIKGLNRTNFDKVLTPDPIESIEIVNKGECRCLTVEEDHSFTLEDIAVKNTLSVSIFWPAWVWTKYPSKRWLFNSYDMKNSIRDSVACRRLIESPKYMQMFGDAYKITSDQNTKIRFDNDRSGYRIASSVNGANTGEGADILTVDDAHNVREKESEAILESTLAWWFETMSSRLNDPKTGGKVVVGQRVREGDLPGAIIKKGGYVHLNLPAEFNPKAKCATILGWEDPRTKEGELLWPNRIGDKEIANLKKELGPTAYAAQYLQSPSPLEGGRFKEYYFRYFDIQGGCYRLFEKDGTTVKKTVDIESCNRFGIMDPAGVEKSVNNKPCYTVIQIWDVTPDGDMLLVHQTRVQKEVPDVVDLTVKVCREFQTPYIAIEKDGIGLGVVQTVRRKGVAVKPIKARGSKEARSETAEIRMASGTVYFGIQDSNLYDIQHELLMFPNGDNCDIVDCVSYAAMMVQQLKGPPLHGEDIDHNEAKAAEVKKEEQEKTIQQYEEARQSARMRHYDEESMWVGLN